MTKIIKMDFIEDLQHSISFAEIFKHNGAQVIYLIKTTVKNNENGFTIIEVLIAIVIFSIGVLAVSHMQVNALVANKTAFEQTEASMWASNKIETFINTPYNDPLMADGLTGSESYGKNDKYNVSWEIEEQPSSLIKKIKIVVSWNSGIIQKDFEFDYVKSGSI